jgi:ribonuclease Z
MRVGAICGRAQATPAAWPPLSSGAAALLLAADKHAPPSPRSIFITHLHGDHCFGLPAVLALLDAVKDRHVSEPRRRRHNVVGPPGLAVRGAPRAGATQPRGCPAGPLRGYRPSGEMGRRALPRASSGWVGAQDMLRIALASTGLLRRMRLPVLVTEMVISPSAAHASRQLEPGAEGGSSGLWLQRLAAKHLADTPQLQVGGSWAGRRAAPLCRSRVQGPAR